MNTKRIKTLISVLLILTFLLCACGKNNDEATSLTSPHYIEGTLKAAVIQYTNDYVSNDLRQEFISRMRIIGYDESKMVFDIYNAKGDSNVLNENINKLTDYNLVVSIGDTATKAVANSAVTTPCVFIGTSDSTASSVSSDKNIRGTVFYSMPDTLLKEIKIYMPKVLKLGVLYDETNETSKADADNFTRIFTDSAYSVEVIAVNSSDIEANTNDLLSRVDAVYIPYDETLANNFRKISDIANSVQKPIFTANNSLLKIGGLMSSCTESSELAQKAADMADSILQGVSISQITNDTNAQIKTFYSKNAGAKLSIKTPNDESLVIVEE